MFPFLFFFINLIKKMENDNVTVTVTEVTEGNTRLQSPSCKSWCYTLNNYTDEDVKRFKDMIFNYQVIGYEVGENGTPHLQGFITFKRTYRLAALKKLVPRAHWEPAKASDAANYCMKEKYDIIDNKQQGKRSDLKLTCDIIKESGIKRAIEEHPDVFVKYHNGLTKLSSHYLGNNKPVPIVTWIWGPTGSGKTKEVFEKETDLWFSSIDLNWFDGYHGQEAVLIDDFRGDMCKFRFLLRLLDRYPLQVPIKGGFVWWVPKRIYITSCKHPSDCYSKDMFDKEEKVEQLLRRLNDIIYKDLN